MDDTAPSADKSVLIIGGTRGLGREFARHAPDIGLHPIVVGRTADRPEVTDDPTLAAAQKIVGNVNDPGTFPNILDGATRDGRLPRYVIMCAGSYLYGKFGELNPERIARVTETMYSGPLALLAAIHRRQRLAPTDDTRYTLVMICSELAYKVDGSQSGVFSGLQAARAQFARTFHLELIRDIRGSSVSIVHPWAMKTDFLAERKIPKHVYDTFLDPADVARKVCAHIQNVRRGGYDPKKGYPAHECSVVRGAGGEAEVVDGIYPPTYP